MAADRDLAFSEPPYMFNFSRGMSKRFRSRVDIDLGSSFGHKYDSILPKTGRIPSYEEPQRPEFILNHKMSPIVVSLIRYCIHFFNAIRFTQQIACNTTGVFLLMQNDLLLYPNG